jgi:peptidoglycan LD-endopeptidase LytH
MTPIAVVALVVSWMLALAAPGGAGSDDGHVQHAFPVRGEVDYGRHHHDYPATDIFAGCGQRVVAPADGVVLEVVRKDRWGPTMDRGGLRGGKFLAIRGHDGARYYLSHLSGILGRVGPGGRVRAGEHLAWAGRTGSARGTPCHVHFGLSPVCRGTGDWRVRRGVVPPYRFLRSWETDRDHSPRRAVLTWQVRHGCRGG